MSSTVVNLSKRRGFVYPCSEIYGGTRSAWDYGPLGVDLKENVRRQWWKAMVQGREDVVGLDSSVILSPQVWAASGHLQAFVDPLTECVACHHRFREDHLIEDYAASCRTEIERAVAAGMPVATTVFVGGGTPTQMPAELLGSVLDAIPMTDDAEVTVECNPDDVSEDLLRAYRNHRVNRVSLGVQSMVDEVLQSLGRTHDPLGVQRAVDAVRAVGMRSFNLDLIYGAAGETVGQWEATLRAAIALSAFCR